MALKTELSASQEDYMEAIYHIVHEKKVARAKEIAAVLKVSQASVTEALKALCKKKLINYAPYEAITLTKKGDLAAVEIVKRHRALKEFFMKILAIEEPVAEKGACQIEHAAPQEIIDRLIAFVDFLGENSTQGDMLIKKFARSLS